MHIITQMYKLRYAICSVFDKMSSDLKKNKVKTHTHPPN